MLPASCQANCYYDINLSFSEDEDDAEASEAAAEGAACSQQEAAESSHEDAPNSSKGVHSSQAAAAATGGAAATVSRDGGRAVAASVLAGAADHEADSSGKVIMADGRAVTPEMEGLATTAAGGAGPACGQDHVTGEQQQQHPALLNGVADGTGSSGELGKMHKDEADDEGQQQQQGNGSVGDGGTQEVGGVHAVAGAGAAGQKRKESSGSRDQQHSTSPQPGPSKRHRSAGVEEQILTGDDEMFEAGEWAADEAAGAEAEGTNCETAAVAVAGNGAAAARVGVESAIEVEVLPGESAEGPGGETAAATAGVEACHLAATPAAACEGAVAGVHCKQGTSGAAGNVPCLCSSAAADAVTAADMIAVTQLGTAAQDPEDRHGACTGGTGDAAAAATSGSTGVA